MILDIFGKVVRIVPAFWKMAAVTVIRLTGYTGIPSCTALYCRRRNVGVENGKKNYIDPIPPELV